MALTKRTYVDGQTIITASNLNEIQDCIIALETNYVPKTRTVAGKALSSNITLTASDVGAVPPTRTVNSKALSSNITLSAADVGAAPTNHASTGTTYGKGTSSNYGHVKISDSLTDTTTAATGGLVPSMKALSDLHGAMSGLIEVSTDNTQDAENKLWIDESADSQIQVPTWAEFQTLNSHVADMTGSLVTDTITRGQNIPSTATLDQTACYKVGNIAVVCARLHSMDFVATNQNAEVIFRLPTGFWPPALVRTASAYVHNSTQSMFMPTIATINANNGYVTFALGTTNHYDQIAFSATFPIREV